MTLNCLVTLLSSWIPSATAAGVGAFCGALGAYYLTCRKEDEKRKSEYLCLLLVVYSHLKSLHSLLADLPESAAKEIDGVQVFEFDLPFPTLEISTEQMQTLMEVSPDKQMPSALIALQHFLKTHSLRVAKSGKNILPAGYVSKQAKQLQFMLLSCRTQYEQAAKDAFPLDALTQK